jgi:hypothetical protein
MRHQKAFGLFRALLGVSLLVLLGSCSTVRQVRPLDEGESALGISLGGPITQVGKPYIPMPLISAAYYRGVIDKKLDVGGGLHLTPLLFGTLDLEAGVNVRPFLSEGIRPGLLVAPKAFFMTDFTPASFRFYPELGLSAFWEVRNNWYLYTGLDNWFELASTRSDGNPQPNNWLIAPHLGLDMGNQTWQFQIEAKLYTPNLPNTGKPTKNIGIGDHGVWGIFLGLNRTFGGRSL